MKRLLITLVLALFTLGATSAQTSLPAPSQKAVKLYEKYQKLYSEGEKDKALKLLHASAKKGYVTAQYKLGGYYAENRGVSQNRTEAAKWYLKAAEQGQVEAQYIIGGYYAKGYGVSQNPTEAAKWYLKAAEQGKVSAQYIIGGYYDKGYGVSQNPTEAAKWYLKAADLMRDYLGRDFESVEEITVWDEPATFQGGGIDEFRKWVMGRLKYPQIALENGIQGNVIIEFVIDEKGKIGRIKVLQSPDPVLSEAAIKVFEDAKKLKNAWMPGLKCGMAVEQKFVMPVSFKLTQ